MKKALHIAIFDGTLKTTPFIQRLIKGLSQRHTITVFGFAESNPNPMNNLHYVPLGSATALGRLLFLSLGFAIRALFQLGKPQQFFRTLGLLFRLNCQALQQQNFNIALQLAKPDILHVQWPSLLPWCEAALQQNNVKVVLSQRGYQNNVRPFVTKENLDYLKQVYPKIDAFHSVSKAISATGDSIYEAPNKIDKVVYSGFNIADFTYRTNYSKGEILNILSIGRPHWVKGYADALQACALLKSEGIPFTYTIVGAKGNEELLYRIHATGLQDKVVLTDKIPQQRVYELMQTQDVLLFPSIAEGLPNVVVEAMLLGLPVIGTRCGGIEELLDDTTGSIVPTRTPKAMAEAISAFYTTAITTIDTQRALARKRVEVQHTATQMIDGMEALYFEVLSQ
ncbi:MAG TPA: glycosyltransferase [Flavobacteriaceae bacterium]|nr:glycosyltransferase [Flavobacteriaceae bacterium]HIN99701.1 glycosyltransferase [Flavobacteriaceae bacterium]